MVTWRAHKLPYEQKYMALMKFVCFEIFWPGVLFGFVFEFDIFYKK